MHNSYTFSCLVVRTNWLYGYVCLQICDSYNMLVSGKKNGKLNAWESVEMPEKQ